MHPLAARRALAHLTDCVGSLGVVAATVPIGAVVATTTDLGRKPLYSHLVSMVPPAIATVLAARAESGPERATWGKRRQGLEVAELDGTRLSVGKALARNTAKVFVPWQLGHAATLSGVWGGFEKKNPQITALTVCAYVATYAVIGTYAATVTRGSGRGVHDLLAGSRVTARARRRRSR